MKLATVLLCWVLLTCGAAYFVPPRSEPKPIAYTAPVVGEVAATGAIGTPRDLTRSFPQLPRVAADVRSLLTGIARSAPTTTTTVRRAPVTTVPRRVYAAGVEQWRSLVAQYPWPVDTMLRVMACESGGRADAVGVAPYYAKGLFQLVPGPAGWDDPATNIRLAYETKYVPSGLTPWVSSSGCW